MDHSPHIRGRFLRAYWTTLVVLASYLSLRITGPFLSEPKRKEVLRQRHVKNAQRIERTIRRLQGLYIKVGQAFSILTNTLPHEFRAELEGLQDAVPPRDWPTMRRRLVDELETEPDQVFSSIEPDPIASASLGQVHRAILLDGTEVAVKIQYPGIEAIVSEDLRTLGRIVHVVSWFIPAQAALGTVYREVEQMVTAELDFRREADSLTRISANFVHDDGVLFPTVYPELSTDRVLTTTFMHGIKITRMEDGDRKRRHRLAVQVIHAYCQQIFEHGVYHADPHPGNLLVTEDDRLIIVDFGAVAELSTAMRQGIVDLLQGVLASNTEGIHAALRSMGFIHRGTSDRVIQRIITVVHERLHGGLQIDSMNLADIRIDPSILFDTLSDLRRLNVGVRELGEYFHIPREWILLERSLLLLMGLCTQLDEKMQPMEHIRPYMERLVLERGGSWQEVAMSTGRDVVLNLLTLPGDLKKLTRDARMGELEVHDPGVSRASWRVYAVGQQLIWTALTITGAILASVFHLQEEPQLTQIASWASVAFGAILLISMFSHSRWRNRE